MANERGYEGGITILKLWLADQYPKQPAPEIIRFETPPGRQAQVDWTAIRRGKNKLSAFVGTLDYSRFSFAWFADHEKFETLIDCHERFFDAIDGVRQRPMPMWEAGCATLPTHASMPKQKRARLIGCPKTSRIFCRAARPGRHWPRRSRPTYVISPCRSMICQSMTQSEAQHE